MRNYIKPSAEVVELSVKESVSLTGKPGSLEFGFGSKKSAKKTIALTTFAANDTSKISTTQG